jgi:flagellar biosynthesis anti-sigma factor FlgM
MRIDLSTGIGLTPAAAEPTKSPLRSSAGPTGSETSSDVSKLSQDYLKVQALVAAISQLPEISQNKVAALAESIQSGTYAVSAQQTAEALVSHMEAAA